MGKRSRKSTNKFKGSAVSAEQQKSSAEWETVDISDQWNSVFVDGTESGFLSLEAIDADVYSAINPVPLLPAEEYGEDSDAEMEEPVKKKKKKKTNKNQRETESVKEETVPLSTEEMVEWTPFELSPLLLQGLAQLRFSMPTPVQQECLPAALLHRKNIVAASQTGSGKTLAFGLPMLDRILRSSDKSNTASKNSSNSLRGLVLAPTRELAMQVSTHLQQVARYTSLRIVPVVGGMSLAKQERLLKSRPEIVVGTPGRLWHWVSSGHVHMSDFTQLEFVAVDEADRLICEGQFGDLYKILEEIAKDEPSTPRQVFLFSATLMSEADAKLREMYAKLARTLGLDLQDKHTKKTAVFDLTHSGQSVSTLSEYQITCESAEKDLLLYYYLSTQPGRTLVFVNSVASIRRLVALLSLLDIPVWALHSNMQQRQRLKNLDRLRKMDKCVLVCSDVAARGLDIPQVAHVVHYHAPRSEELYVHRSGRTARAGASGQSVALVSGEDAGSYKGIWSRLYNGVSIPSMSVDGAVLRTLRERIELAAAIDHEEHFTSTRKTSRDWFVQNAEAMDMILDEEVLKRVSYDERDSGEKRIGRKLQELKRKLKALLGKEVQVEKGKRASRFVTVNGSLLL